jgi:hypothetical protein
VMSVRCACDASLELVLQVIRCTEEAVDIVQLCSGSTLVSPGVHWCPLVPTGVPWCPLVYPGVHWCPLVSTGVI